VSTPAELRELLAAATPGPWEVTVDQHRAYEVPEVGVWSSTAGAYVTEDVVTHEGSTFPANAALIVAMHAALPGLLDLADRVAEAQELAARPTTLGERLTFPTVRGFLDRIRGAS
jgi:hypothetical protein